MMNQVRAACQRVAERAVRVRIRRRRIPAYAESLELQTHRRPQLDPGCHYLGHGKKTVAFILTLDAINFGSGYFPHLHKRPGMSGYFTIASRLTEHFLQHGPLSAAQLAELTAPECARLFGQHGNAGPAYELMHLFAGALNQLGQHLAERFRGDFSALVDGAGGSAEKLVSLLIEMSCFQDVHTYQELQVPFYKRAQLAAADLSLAFAGKGRGRFHDLDRLTIFADNLVPHVLRVDGILEYDAGLASRIDAEQPIPRGTAEEVEIRACALHAAELIVAELQRRGRHITAMQLDYFLWNRGQQPYYKSRPRHRTPTIFY